MILRAISRSKTGNKIHTTLSGYTGPKDLELARQAIKKEIPQAHTILFLIPKETS